MNYWTVQSLNLANQSDYLDRLSEIYDVPLNQEREDLDAVLWQQIEAAYRGGNNEELVALVLRLNKSPISEPYLGYLRLDISAINRNPQTINRIANRLHEYSLRELKVLCQQPINPSRQMGAKFKNWLTEEHLGLPVFDNVEDFDNFEGNAVLSLSDNLLKEYAERNLGYTREKGLDFLAKIKGQYVIGEAKLLTNEGGSQNNQFNDAVSLLDTQLRDDIVIHKIAIIDGVVYIGSIQRFMNFYNRNEDKVILSCLKLREYIDSLR